MAFTQGGIELTWGAEHLDGDGRLISRQASLAPPPPPSCLTPKCLFMYLGDVLYFVLLANWHQRRVAYAEKNRDKKILERYRTGEPAPWNIWQAIHANIKLTCPVCRKYNIDPLKGGNNGTNTETH